MLPESSGPFSRRTGTRASYLTFKNHEAHTKRYLKNCEKKSRITLCNSLSRGRPCQHSGLWQNVFGESKFSPVRAQQIQFGCLPLYLGLRLHMCRFRYFISARNPSRLFQNIHSWRIDIAIDELKCALQYFNNSSAGTDEIRTSKKAFWHRLESFLRHYQLFF